MGAASATGEVADEICSGLVVAVVTSTVLEELDSENTDVDVAKISGVVEVAL